MNYNDYPEPDIPADEAWADMKKVLNANSGKSDTKKNNNPIPSKLFLYIGAGVAIISTIVYFLIPKEQEIQSPVAMHTSQDKPIKDTLSAGAVVFLDSYSTVIESMAANKESLLTVKGAAYFQNITNKNQMMYRLKIGSIVALPVNAALYLSFDSALSVSSVQVLSGKAMLETNGEKQTLTAGESVMYDEKEKRMSINQQSDVNLFSYATLIFDFNNTPLTGAIKCIEKAYGISIVVENKKLLSCRITTRFDNKSLNEVLDVIAYTLNFEYRMNEKMNQVILTGDGCE